MQDLTDRIADHPLLADLAVALAGGLLVLAFAPFEWRLLAVISPAILFLLCLDSAPGRAFRRGYLFGLAQFGFGVTWTYNSIHEFGHAPVVLAAALAFGLVLVLATFPALCGWLARRWFRLRRGVMLVAVFPALWVLMEWVRSWLFTGFPWLLLGHSQVDMPLAGAIPILGVYGGSWLAVLTSGLLVLCVVRELRKAWPPVVAIAVIWVGCWQLGSVNWTQSLGRDITASLVQGNIQQDVKWKPEHFKTSLALYRDLTRESWGSDLVIWPESAVPAYYHQLSDTFLTPLAEEGAALGSQLLVGIFYRDEATGRKHNSLVHAGHEESVYNKRHLVPFGEYMPFRSLLEWLSTMVEIPMSDLDPGTGRPLMQVGDWPIGISICYEDAYGNETLEALPEAQVLVNISNDAWFGDSLAPHQHLEIARMRALETGRALLRSTNTGISASIGPKGRILDRLPQFESGVLATRVPLHEGITPFTRWGNWAIVLFLLSLSFAALAAGRLPVARA